MKPFELVEDQPAGSDRFIGLTLKGYLDAHTVTEFESHMDRLMEQGGRRYLLDISELNYISSAGIGAIMGLTQRLRRNEGELVLLRPNEKVFKILEKLGFTKIFRLAWTREEGERMLGG